ncbi:LysM domain receptor-like kinase 3 [Linum grandiflorum]
MNPNLGLGVLILASILGLVAPQCSRGCDLALASYYVWEGSNLTYILQLMKSTVQRESDFDGLLSYNRQIANKDSVFQGSRINIPFPCECINGQLLGHVFLYPTVTGDTYDRIAGRNYANLTTVDWLRRFNTYPAENIPDTNAVVNVTVNCSCGDSLISREYGLFVTYPLQQGDSLDSLARSSNVSGELLQRYNAGVNFSSGRGLVYVPGRDASNSYRPLTSSSSGGLSGGFVAGISIAAVAVAVLLGVCIYVKLYRKKKAKETVLLPAVSLGYSPRGKFECPGTNSDKPSESTGGAGSGGLTGITVDKSVEFSYEELSKATDDFSLANKIGQGGFGAVYYAELRGEKAAIKKMDMQASKEFFAELKVLTHVHHLNLVRLIGYCVEGSLFLVYEFIENGNLSQHLRGSEREPLSWSARVQIALDSARGLEYIHEHTVPVYIHRDIKSANILIDKNYRAKVADFGLTKLTEVGSTSLPTRLVGTFGYMPPEYAQYGDVSPKVDVYALGVVLYELISAKEAIVKPNGSNTESRGLVALFEDVLDQPDPQEDIRKLVDPRLGDNYPLDAVRKMAQLAKACTQENPQLRPSMRSIVVALMTLSSATEDWDVGSFYDNQALVNLMSGR